MLTNLRIYYVDANKYIICGIKIGYPDDLWTKVMGKRRTMSNIGIARITKRSLSLIVVPFVCVYFRGHYLILKPWNNSAIFARLVFHYISHS